jgi:S-adenosylmethionine decarboxylase
LPQEVEPVYLVLFFLGFSDLHYRFGGGGAMFFEGPEKKVEIVVKDVNLRQLGDDFWRAIVAACHAQILSKRTTTQMDAYLLSESSLFVWEDYCLLITCGQTTLVSSIIKLVEQLGIDKISSLIFQRKNEYFGHLQKSHFHQDAARLAELFHHKAHALQLGALDGHHNFLFHLDRTFNPPAEDRTTEMLMYHLGIEASQFLQQHHLKTDQIRQFLKLDELLPDWIIDDHVFSPVGYSVNAIKADRYLTIHITPQEDSSYVSCETNMDTEHTHKHVLAHFLNVLCPGSFDFITFNHENFPDLPRDKYLCLDQARENLRCGYVVQFSHFWRVQGRSRSGKAHYLDLKQRNSHAN